MEDEKLKEDTDATDEQYDEDEEVIECAECGTAVKEEKKVARKIGDEEYFFCSKMCAHDFEESVAEG